jgi:hypothetical protein
MKDHLHEIVAQWQGSLQKICAAREYLQARMLQTLQEAGVFRHRAFVGGTALRFRYSIPRFSEDLDFSKVFAASLPDFGKSVSRIRTVFEAAVLDTTLVRRLGLTPNLTHHDKASLPAGKVHVLLTRTCAKGRDLYDLIWYLADPGWPAPNMNLLAAALAQTGWTGPVPTATTWRGVLAERLVSVNWRAAQGDVSPFLEREADRNLVTRDNAMSLLNPMTR